MGYFGRMQWTPARALTATMFGLSASLLLFELALTRVFGVVLFASCSSFAPSGCPRRA